VQGSVYVKPIPASSLLSGENSLGTHYVLSCVRFSVGITT
jgi:hypothetical protein